MLDRLFVSILVLYFVSKNIFGETMVVRHLNLGTFEREVASLIISVFTQCNRWSPNVGHVLP